MDNHDYCRLMLRDTRNECGKIPPISSSKLFDDHYAVFIGNDWYDEYSACCAFYARAEAIIDFTSRERSPLNRTTT